MADTNINYWEDTALNLYYNSKTDYSIDENGAKTYNKKATASGQYVTDLQKDLIVIGYLVGKADGSFGPATKRALIRFQRRAKTTYRVKKGAVAADVSNITYCGKVNGICDVATAKELRTWIKANLMTPLGRFKLMAITGGRLRSDAAVKWTALVRQVKDAGGSIASPYGDTTRSVTFRKSTGGNSLYSLHYTGRAVDLNQGFAGGKKQIYYVEKEDVGGNVFWRIHCKTTLQNGSQGKKIKKTEKKKYYSFWARKEIDMPEAYYIDITKMLDEGGFIRIKAHSDWKTNSKGQEWWHFHFNKNLQETFQDEMELLGNDEATLKKNGWNSNTKLDRKPG